jgi:hypothetical protein
MALEIEYGYTAASPVTSRPRRPYITKSGTATGTIAQSGSDQCQRGVPASSASAPIDLRRWHQPHGNQHGRR